MSDWAVGKSQYEHEQTKKGEQFPPSIQRRLVYYGRVTACKYQKDRPYEPGQRKEDSKCQENRNRTKGDYPVCPRTE